MNENDDLIPEFLAEAAELLEKVYQDLTDLSSGVPSDQIQGYLDSLFRNIHTVKGGCGMFNFVNTQEVAHGLESHLSELKSSTPKEISAEEISYIRDKTQQIEALLNRHDSADEEVATAEAPVPVNEDVTSAPGVVEKKTETANIKKEETNSSKTVEYIRVPVNRINESISEISEIFLIRNQMVHLVGKRKMGQIDERDFYQSWDQLDAALRRGIGELERSTMNMRMAPVSGLFSRMGRVIQSYKSENKKIEFKIFGENTELDKKVLDTLAEPLVHLVRNAMDHGIETMDIRKSAGKPLHGTIELKAAIVGNEAVIEISDDGKGIDGSRILASAQEKGLDVSHISDDKAAIDLIFMPGFSTAQTLSEISGRGVGMDAVKSSVNALGGKINIQTQVGQGSTFTIKLPVSVSVSPVVIVNIKGLKYAVPNQDILEIRQTNIRKVEKNNGKDYVKFRDAFIECIDTRNIITEQHKDHEENMSEASFLFFQQNEKIIAARVSSFESNTEIVVKPASKLIPSIPWISGVSVLPTGESIFVISLDRILEQVPKEVKYAC